MKYEDAVEIETLAADVFAKREKIAMMRMANTPIQVEERERAFVALEMAIAELSVSEGKLQRAQGQMFAYGHLRNETKDPQS